MENQKPSDATDQTSELQFLAFSAAFDLGTAIRTLETATDPIVHRQFRGITYSLRNLKSVLDFMGAGNTDKWEGNVCAAEGKAEDDGEAVGHR